MSNEAGDAPAASDRLECAILVGLQASGKSTFYARRFASTHRHVSKDALPNARPKEPRQRRLIEEALSSGVSVVVDNTNPTEADRAPIIALARAYGARVVGYFFDASIRECVGRNRRREGRQAVPDVAIFTTAGRLRPPAAEEGFDEVFRVRVLEDGSYEVTRTR
jgi:predicted kinase